MATLGLLIYNNKRCDNQLDWDNIRYKVSVFVFHSPLRFLALQEGYVFR
jgi:hypothetical protein